MRFHVPIKNILGLNYYRYELTTTNYNPTIDSTITITCHCTNAFGNNVNGKTITLYDNGTSVGSATTEDGIATWTITLSDWNVHHFNVSNTSLDIKAKGWRIPVNDGIYTLKYNDKIVSATINYPTTVNWSTTVGHLGAEWLKDNARGIDLRPPMPVSVTQSANKVVMLSNTDYRVGWFTNTGTSTGGIYAHFLYARK